MSISDAQFAAWLKNDNADRRVLVEMDYQVEVAGAPVTETLYFSDGVYFDGTGTHPYVDAITTVPEYTRSLLGDPLGTFSSSLGTLELANADSALDSLLTLAIDGSAIRFYLGDVSWTPSDFRLIFSALSLKATAPAFDSISVTLKDTGLLLDKSIGGTSQIGGTGPNSDQYKAVNFGLVRQIVCTVKDTENLIYVHSDTGDGLQSSFETSYVETVRDRGLPVVFTDNSDGTVTLAASPDGQITADVLYTYGGNPSYFCVSDHMRFFVGDRCGIYGLGLYYGPGPTFSVRPSTSAEGIAGYLLNGGEDFPLGVNLSAARNVQDLLTDITNSGLCFWAIRRDGQFTFGRLRPSNIAILNLTAARTITEDDIDDGSFQMDQLDPGYYLLQAYMNKNWSIQTDLASSIDSDQRSILTRDGLILLQNDPADDTYVDAPQLYNKTLTRSPLIETLLSYYDNSSGSIHLSTVGSDLETMLRYWMDVRLASSLPWISIPSATVGIDFYDVELGDLVKMQMPHYGYDAGVDLQCVSINIKLPSKIDIKLARRDVQGPYHDTPANPPIDSSFLVREDVTVTNDRYLHTDLLLHLNGPDGGRVFIDSSQYARTIAAS